MKILIQSNNILSNSVRSQWSCGIPILGILCGRRMEGNEMGGLDDGHKETGYEIYLSCQATFQCLIVLSN